MRRLLLRIGDACARSLPPEWGEAARAEARAVEGTWELARWTVGLARLALLPARAGRRRRRAR